MRMAHCLLQISRHLGRPLDLIAFERRDTSIKIKSRQPATGQPAFPRGLALWVLIYRNCLDNDLVGGCME